MNRIRAPRPWAFYFLAGSAVLTALVGALVIYGWHIGNFQYVTVVRDWPVVPYHTAWATLGIGLGYLSWSLRARGLAMILAAVVLTLTLLTALHYWAGVDIALEARTLRWAGVQGTPILMSPNAAVTFSILAIALLGLARQTRGRRLLAAIGFAASITAALAVSAILGYLIGMPSAHQWGRVPAYAFLPITLALLLSLSVLGYVWSSARLSARDWPRWMPVAVWLVFVSATALFVDALKTERDQIAAVEAQRFALDIASTIERELQTRTQSLERMASRVLSGAVQRAQWDIDASRHMGDFAAYDSISLLRSGQTEAWVVRQNNAPAQSDASTSRLAATLEQQVRHSQHLGFSPVFRAPNGAEKILLRVPLLAGNDIAGFIGATLDIESLISGTLRNLASEVSLKLSDQDGKVFYTRGPQIGDRGSFANTRLKGPGLDWAIELDPGELLAPTQSRLPEFALVGGLLFATLLAYAVRLFQISRAHALETEEVNLRLVDEIEERTRLEERTRQIVESAYDAFVSIDAQGNITDWNPRAEQVFGWSRDQAIGRSLAETIVPPLYREAHTRGMRRYQESGKSQILNQRLEMPAINRAGEEFPIEMTITALHDGNLVTFNAFIHDISERQAMQQRLIESRDFYLRLFEDFPALVWRAGPDGQRDYFNRTWLDFTGRTLEQELGDGWRVNLHEDDAAEYIQRLERALAARAEYEFEFRLCNAQQEFRWVIETGRPYLDLEGNYAGYIGSCLDVTRAKQLANALAESNQELESRVETRTRELYQTNIQLKQEIEERAAAQNELRRYADDLARTNSELEQFAYVASHDLQEPLRMVSSYAQLLHRRYFGKLDADAADFIGFIVEGAMRMQQLIEDLLAFSRLGSRPPQFVSVDSAVVVQSARTNLEKALTQAGIAVEVGPLPVVTGDMALLVQLFQALFSNAIKFRQERAPYIKIQAQRHESEWEFSVADNGIGIEPQYFQRIFVIFQRLHSKADFPGTGIGLAICKKIVERHGGRIWLESEMGKGSTFYFTLRAADHE